MKLAKLLNNIKYEKVIGRMDVEVGGVCHDNRKIKPGDMFICVTGALFDSHSCAAEVAKKGAAALVIEHDIDLAGINIPVVKVNNSREASAYIAAAWYGNPAQKMKMIGITGSKGKTTTAYMMRDILSAAGHTVGMVGTNGVFIGEEVFETPNTTPDPMDFQCYLSKMVDEKCDFAVIECSSQGIMQFRVAGITFDYGVFTNISDSDHVGPPEHKDFAEYLHYKSLLIKNSRLGFVNDGDEHTNDLLKGLDTPIIRFGFSGNVDYCAENIEKTMVNDKPGASFAVSGRLSGDFHINMPGDFNVLNALAAISVANEIGVPQDAMRRALEKVFIKGRIEMIYRSDKFSVCVDYSHNGYSMKNLLIALREYNPKRLVSIFGADGYRVHKRRYEMGEVSGEYADFSIITAGQSRWESFDDILKEILVGIEKTGAPYVVIPDRKEAVRYAIKNAKPGDLIALIGLGGKKHYEEKGVMYEYREDEYALSIIEELNKK